MHQLELLAVTCCFLNIYLLSRDNIWNWLFGVLNVSLYLIIFYQVKLYADMALQTIFFLMQFYGCYQWLYGGKNHTALSISKGSLKIYWIAVYSIIILFLTIAFVLKQWTDSTTVYIDSFTTALSLVAQWMMSKKFLEHWWLWISVNVVSINMYFNKSLYFTSCLYAFFILLNIFGYQKWKKQLKINNEG